MAKKLGTYRNGNVDVSIYDDGTKIRFTEDDEFKPEFAESMDINITTVCDGGCPFCYQNGNKGGKHANLRSYEELINSLHPYTEIALNGNDLSHPDLEWFLNKLKEKKVIANMTINQIHFMREPLYNKLVSLLNKGLINGLGISLQTPNDKFIENVKSLPNPDNVVIHIINGIHGIEKLKPLYDKEFKILVLGYKTVGRGIDYKCNVDLTNSDLNKYLEEISNHFVVMSFDNLAIEQLGMKDRVDSEIWNECFQGEEGSISFYLDLVDNRVAKSSLETNYKDITNQNIDYLFNLATDKMNKYKVTIEKLVKLYLNVTAVSSENNSIIFDSLKDAESFFDNEVKKVVNNYDYKEVNKLGNFKAFKGNDGINITIKVQKHGQGKWENY